MWIRWIQIRIRNTAYATLATVTCIATVPDPYFKASWIWIRNSDIGSRVLFLIMRILLFLCQR